MGQLSSWSSLDLQEYPTWCYSWEAFISLVGLDFRQPIEAALLPQTPTNELVLSDYREELVKILSSARQCAAKCIQNAQRKYKTQYDKRIKPVQTSSRLVSGCWSNIHKKKLEPTEIVKAMVWSLQNYRNREHQSNCWTNLWFNQRSDQSPFTASDQVSSRLPSWAWWSGSSSKMDSVEKTIKMITLPSIIWQM